MILANAKVCDDNFCLIDADIEIDGDVISKISPKMSGKTDRLDLAGCIILPGLIDLHIHGCAGGDTCDGTEQALRTMSSYLASQGVTSFCPTTMTVSNDSLMKILKNVRDFMGSDAPGARAVGVHMEGPYISPLKSGVQKSDHVHSPDWPEFQDIVRAFPDLIKIVDIAPETSGAMEFIEQAKKLCVVSMSHSAADYDIAMLSFEKGITHVTHLFNAMNGIHHRSPGAAGAVLDNDSVMAEIICDGVHLHPAVIRIACRMLGEDRSILVSDSMRAAGLPDGSYELGGQWIQVRDGRTYFENAQIAGSTTNLYQEAKNLLRYGIPWRQVIKSASINPAKQLGMDTRTGSITPGKLADLLILDQHMEIRSVYIQGKKMA